MASARATALGMLKVACCWLAGVVCFKLKDLAVEFQVNVDAILSYTLLWALALSAS